jgi:hypothetical protein
MLVDIDLRRSVKTAYQNFADSPPPSVPIRQDAAGVHLAEGLYKATGKVAAVLRNPRIGDNRLRVGETNEPRAVPRVGV